MLCKGGGSSEPAALIGLGAELFNLYSNSPTQIKMGWAHQGFKLEELVTGISHVGDALVASRILCAECLHTGMKKLYPKDVGVSREGSGTLIRFLQVVTNICGSVKPKPKKCDTPHGAKSVSQTLATPREPVLCYYGTKQRTKRLL